MTVFCAVCILAAVVGVGATTLIAYRRGVCDGRAMQAIHEFFPDEARRKGRII